MKQFYTYRIFLMLMLSCYSQIYAQFNNGFANSTPYITAYFQHEDLIIEPGKSFFNLLVIKNEGESTVDAFPDINAPIGWSVITGVDPSYRIYPRDSVLVPVRVAPAKEVEGEIGYSLIAAINNRSGDTYTNAYCFIKVKRQTDLQFRPITRMNYFDQQTHESQVSFQIINRGNVGELLYMDFESTRNISMEGERENVFSTDIMLRPGTDTIVNYKVKAVDDRTTLNGSLYRIDLRAQTIDRSFGTSFWFNHMSNQYRYRIPETEKILIAELAAQNLLAEQSPSTSVSLRGNLLFPDHKGFNYYVYRHSAAPGNDFLRYGRFRLAYNTRTLNLVAGDLSGLDLKYGGGKGGSFTYRIPRRMNITAIANRNTFRPITNMGIQIDDRYTPYRLGTSFAYSQNNFLENRAFVGGLSGNFNINPNHRFRTLVSMSQVNYKIPQTSKYGLGLNLDYSGRIGNTRIRLREQLGSDFFYGRYSGRHNLSLNIFQPLSENWELDLYGFDQKFKPLTETPMGIDAERFLENRRINLIARNRLDRGLIIYGGPVYQRKATNSFYLFDSQTPFISHSAKLNLGTRISSTDGISINPSATFGYTFITDYSTPGWEIYPYNLQAKNTRFFNSIINLNIRSHFWGIFASHYYGPFSVNQEISNFYYSIETHTIRLMPYIERYIYQNIVKVTSRLNYTYDFPFKTSRVNLNNQLDIYLPHDYSISMLNTYGYQKTTDLITEVPYTYSNNYFEVRVKKEFNWNQPRTRYYDLTVNMFKDLNGNLRREPNEPGIRDIIVHITSIEPHQYGDYDIDYNPPTQMVSRRLLTGMDGTITYENLPMGLYKIELENIGQDQDKYFPDQNEFIINVTRDKTVYVPYLERNKIFGRVIMNRSRLSALGRIEVGNIKVTATDTKGRETATLTDSRGYFEMYVPSVDNYVVTINNIFRDHFNLRQNNFRANLNGFKQFEVNFVFDEIRRQIEFSPGFTEVEAEIRRVGRTNLSGVVRDASTLQPIRAQIEVVDNQTGNSIAQTVTDRATGRYNTSFVTGEDYMLVVTANGYWIFNERLVLDQYLTIQDAERDVLLEGIAIGARFQLNNLRFSPGSAEIPTEALPELDRLINQLRQNPNVRIRLEGHSDGAEALDYANISTSRAEAVMRYMIQNGFSNIEYTGLRDSQPAAPSDTEENRRRNRRVEIIVVDR